ncbi:MAG: hypothetical protein QS721_05185 [Candidatus Endonucleobacter sp. (ex Gigantidas childressi)]|nr:hypothetical protein [Candidatus Endonucleobacter sp. (ex Gigantidas childressi)]
MFGTKMQLQKLHATPDRMRLYAQVSSFIRQGGHNLCLMVIDKNVLSLLDLFRKQTFFMTVFSQFYFIQRSHLNDHYQLAARLH